MYCLCCSRHRRPRHVRSTPCKPCPAPICSDESTRPTRTTLHYSEEVTMKTCCETCSANVTGCGALFGRPNRHKLRTQSSEQGVLQATVACMLFSHADAALLEAVECGECSSAVFLTTVPAVKQSDAMLQGLQSAAIATVAAARIDIDAQLRALEVQLAAVIRNSVHGVQTRYPGKPTPTAGGTQPTTLQSGKNFGSTTFASGRAFQMMIGSRCATRVRLRSVPPHPYLLLLLFLSPPRWALCSFGKYKSFRQGR